MLEALDKSWSLRRQMFIQDNAESFSRYVDETLEAIFDGTGCMPEELCEGMGVLTLSILHIASGEIIDQDELQDYDLDAYHKLGELLDHLEDILCYHRPFPAEYRGRYTR